LSLHDALPISHRPAAVRAQSAEPRGVRGPAPRARIGGSTGDPPMIRLGSLAGYPFEGPRLLSGWTPPARPAVYAIMVKPDPDGKPETYAVIYVGHADDLSAEQFPFNHPRAECWIRRAGNRWRIYICTYEVPGGLPSHREQIMHELGA